LSDFFKLRASYGRRAVGSVRGRRILAQGTPAADVGEIPTFGLVRANGEGAADGRGYGKGD